MKRGDLPDVYSALSYRQFLRDWYEARKAADRRFSHRLFARRAGVSSPSLFNEVVAGKRNLTPVTLEGFIRALGLDDEEASFFRDLVQLDQGATPAERSDAWERIAASRRFRSARPIEGASFDYLSTWYLPAIRELALRGDFRFDPAWVARQLSPPISRMEAREALDTLVDLGMLVPADDGSVEVVDVSLATPHQVVGLAVHNYHRQMLERALDSITGHRSIERHLVGVTVAVPASLVPTLKEELDRFQERLLHLCDDHVDDAERVYQVHLALFPLSQAPETP